ncbi:MAG: 5-oxoprolinase subunit PxpA [Hydrogenophilus sp.]
MTLTLNLNADLGESYGAWSMGNDAAMLALVQSASLACGFHGGDPVTARKTLALARAAQVSVGAHPSYPDLLGFGRREMAIPPEELEALLLYQIGALATLAASEGVTLTHVKPHGALYNRAWRDPVTARAIVRAVQTASQALAGSGHGIPWQNTRALILLAPPHSALAAAGHDAALPVAHEIFADRAYTADGTLVPRSEPGAVLHDPDAVLRHVQTMLEAGGVVTATGEILPAPIHAICVHGDTPEAVAIAQALAATLQEQGVALAPLPAMPDFVRTPFAS